METDYLNTDFDKAEKKLRAAIDACGDSGCAPAIKSQLYIGLGSVLAGGRKQLDDAKDAFVEALKLDKDVKVDPDWASTEISFAFEKARAEVKGGKAPATPAPVGGAGVEHTPVGEQRISTPVPLWVEVSEELAPKVKKVSVAYKGPGGTEWKTLVMRKVGERGFGINVPCGDVNSEGKLRYSITVEGAEGEVLGTAGSRAKPVETSIKSKLEGDAPHWPDHAPPEPCAAPPPPGPKQCVDDGQCNADLKCVQGECVAKATETTGASRKNWFTLAFSPDVSFVSGDGVCTKDSQANEHWACFRDDGTRYVGTPTTKGESIGDNVNFGPSLSTLRLVLGYERAILDNLTLGLRAGFAFNGAPSGADFLPVHAEGRAAYWIGKQPFAGPGARPFLFLSGGVAQFDTKVSVQVLEDGKTCGAADPGSRTSKCTKPSADGRVERRIQDLDAYRQAGFGFVGGGLGLAYAPLPAMALVFSVRGAVTLPVVTAVVSPELGVQLGF